MNRILRSPEKSLQSLSSWYPGVLRPGATTPVDLVMIQSTSFCNIDCSYCYLPKRNDKSRFKLEALPLLVERLNEGGLLGAELSIAWHAGEPLVLPPDYYAQAAEILNAVVPTGTQVRHSFQTNGLLISEEYCQLFKDLNANVGVSLDGPETVHNSRRLTRDGRGTYAGTIKGYERLKAASITPSIIAVVTNQSVADPDGLYNFFRELSPREVGFNIEEIESGNATSSLSIPEVRLQMHRFFSRLLEREAADPTPLPVRELRNGRTAVAGAIMSPNCGSSENNPFSIISVDTRGNVSTFSPELLQVPGDSARFTLGNIQSSSFSEMASNFRYKALAEEIGAGVTKCRNNCDYFAMCGGGAPANKLAEHGRFDVSETMHCRLTVMALVDALEDKILAQMQRRRPSAAPAPGAGVKLLPKGLVGLIGQRRTTQSGGTWQPRFPLAGKVRVTCPPDRLSRSSGTCAPTNLGFDEALFKTDVFVARSPWLPLNLSESTKLTSRSAHGQTNFVDLVTLPEPVVELALRLGQMSARSPLDRGKPTVDLSNLQTQVANGVMQALGSKSDLKVLGVVVSPPGLPTLTTDLEDHLLWGLHVDSWFQLPNEQRNAAPNRLGINIGCQPRQLLFIDIGLDEIHHFLAHRLQGQVSAYDLGRTFMRTYPDYPVLSLRVDPGEAYIAATENLIHDGCSTNMTQSDALLTLLGHFSIGL